MTARKVSRITTSLAGMAGLQRIRRAIREDYSGPLAQIATLRRVRPLRKVYTRIVRRAHRKRRGAGVFGRRCRT